MALMNDDELDFVSGGDESIGGGEGVVLMGRRPMPADDCPVFSAYSRFYNNCDCINCEHYDYGFTEKCTNPSGIRFEEE